MAIVVYVLCAVTSITCSVMLFRAYRGNGVKLLFWSALCFSGLALNNILLVVDLGVLPEVDLSIIRSLPAVAGVGALLYGLIWDVR